MVSAAAEVAAIDGIERRVGGSVDTDVMASCPAATSKSARLVIFVNLYTSKREK